MSTVQDALRSLPSVERLLSVIRGDSGGAEHAIAVQLAREVIDEARERIRGGGHAPDLESLSGTLKQRVSDIERPPVRRVINATGVIVHTNLGRAPLSPRALEAVAAVGSSYSNLEYELEAGKRGSRHEHCNALIRRLTGAPASAVVNNNAAAMLLVLAEIAMGREVIISRGELVEIGGGFRIPDVLRQSGARLVEVGTTNRTYADDYSAVIGPETGALLRVHSSNFRVIGFTHQPTLEELVQVAHSHDLPVIEDLGSGSLLDSSVYGLASEPTVQASLAAGVDLVCFSGDKLLGGPQAGIIVGRADLVARVKRHPLMRALRPDKLTIAALAATLTEYVEGTATTGLPVWRMIATDVEALEERAQRLCQALAGLAISANVIPGRSTVGGGALPEETLPTRLVRLTHPSLSAAALLGCLRASEPPIVGRVENDAVVLDLRTVAPSEDAEVRDALLSGEWLQPTDGQPEPTAPGHAPGAARRA